jgi:hypothetical protein
MPYKNDLKTNSFFKPWGYNLCNTVTKYRVFKKSRNPWRNAIKMLFFCVMQFSYNKCWKCPPLRSSQRCAYRIMLANSFCIVPVDILSTVRWTLAWSSCSVCVDDLNTQYPWDAPIKRSLGGLSSGIVEATIPFKWGVQETQIPSNPWDS